MSKSSALTMSCVISIPNLKGKQVYLCLIYISSLCILHCPQQLSLTSEVCRTLILLQGHIMTITYINSTTYYGKIIVCMRYYKML